MFKNATLNALACSETCLEGSNSVGLLAHSDIARMNLPRCSDGNAFSAEHKALRDNSISSASNQVVPTCLLDYEPWVCIMRLNNVRLPLMGV